MSSELLFWVYNNNNNNNKTQTIYIYMEKNAENAENAKMRDSCNAAALFLHSSVVVQS